MDCNFALYLLLANSFQASGYGSGDDIYDDTETGDEVKKVVEEREFIMVSDITEILYICDQL